MAAVSTKYGVGASRVSHFINRKPASHLYHAVRIAAAIGLPLTHLVTINFDPMACTPEEVSSRFEKIRASRFGPWIRRAPRNTAAKGCPPTYVWVIENVSGIVHVHWLLHIPANRVSAFKTKLPKWVEAITAAPIASGDIDIKFADNPLGILQYMLKGIDPVWAKHYGTSHRRQGEVHGKRSGYSRNLGPTEKKRLREAGQYRKARRNTKVVSRAAA